MAGPLYSLFKYRLGELTPQVVEAWAIAHGKERPTYGRLCWRYFKVFLGWCSREPAFQDVIDPKIATSRKVRDAFGKPNAKNDHLEREQLKHFFEEVRAIQNPVTAASIQVMLLTGARVNEVLGLKWCDVDERWKKIAIHDKVEGARTIPLTPFVWQLIKSLPRRNEQVFSSHDSKTGSIWNPRFEFVAACKRAGIQNLTLHGLRRSFASLSEWLDIPSGVIAQIMGHKPSATAEKHYKRRSVEMLRIHHERFEAWMIEQAEVDFYPSEKRLVVVK
jgi:integrase